jgi:hypothetical protein
MPLFTEVVIEVDNLKIFLKNDRSKKKKNIEKKKHISKQSHKVLNPSPVAKFAFS